MSNVVPPPGRPNSLGFAIDRLRPRWGWLIAYGVFNALLGTVALVLTETATIASVLTIGVFMIIGGMLEIGIGFRARNWGGMALWEVAGILYLVVGFFAVAQPEITSVIITLLLGAGLIATGLVRIYLGAQMAGTRSRAGLFLAGLVSALLGLMIVIQWPASSTFVLGIFLGIDLLVYGVTWIVVGTRLAMHRH